MGLLGCAALGLVLGWVVFLVARGMRGILAMSSRALIFAAAVFFGAAALALIHVGPSGALTTSIGVGVGALCAWALLGVKASSIAQAGG